MQKVVAAYLKAYPNKYLFEQEQNSDKPKGKGWPPKVLAAALERTDIVKHVSYHVLRHSYATILLDLGVDYNNIRTSSNGRGTSVWRPRPSI